MQPAARTVPVEHHNQSRDILSPLSTTRMRCLMPWSTISLLLPLKHKTSFFSKQVSFISTNSLEVLKTLVSTVLCYVLLYKWSTG